MKPLSRTEKLFLFVAVGSGYIKYIISNKLNAFSFKKEYIIYPQSNPPIVKNEIPVIKHNVIKTSQLPQIEVIDYSNLKISSPAKKSEYNMYGWRDIPITEVIVYRKSTDGYAWGLDTFKPTRDPIKYGSTCKHIHYPQPRPTELAEQIIKKYPREKGAFTNQYKH